MEAKRFVFLSFLLSLVLSACSSSQPAIRQGMTRNEVLKLLGPPSAMIIRDGRSPEEYLTYTLPMAQVDGNVSSGAYAISIVNGRVNEFGDAVTMGLSGPGF